MPGPHPGRPGAAHASEALAREHAITDVLIDEQATVMHAYGVWGTPFAVLVASDGTVRSAPVAGHVAIESLIRLALQREIQPAPAYGYPQTRTFAQPAVPPEAVLGVG